MRRSDDVQEERYGAGAWMQGWVQQKQLLRSDDTRDNC
jgi:hypothetical protein